MASLSQRSSNCAPRASATWRSGTPSENSSRLRDVPRVFVRGQKAEKSALDFAAAFARVLRDHEQTRVRIGCEPGLRPKRTRGEFCGRIGRKVKFGLFRSGPERSFAHTIVSAPRGEQFLLRRQNAVEAGKQQRRALRCVGLEFGGEFERKARGADEFAIAAEFVKCSEPAAERSGVLIPANARIVFEKLRSVVAEQMVRVHGERGQAIARASELHGFGRGMGHNARPERLLLKRAQHHAAVDDRAHPRPRERNYANPECWEWAMQSALRRGVRDGRQWRGSARRVRWQ